MILEKICRTRRTKSNEFFRDQENINFIRQKSRPHYTKTYTVVKNHVDAFKKTPITSVSLLDQIVQEKQQPMA